MCAPRANDDGDEIDSKDDEEIKKLQEHFRDTGRAKTLARDSDVIRAEVSSRRTHKWDFSFDLCV